jgi:hypothetical protein
VTAVAWYQRFRKAIAGAVAIAAVPGVLAALNAIPGVHIAAGLFATLTAIGALLAGGSTVAAVPNTIQTPGTVDGDLAVPERIVAVSASTTPFLIPLASKNYKRPAGGADAGKAYVDYSAVTSVTRAVISLPLS